MNINILLKLIGNISHDETNKQKKGYAEDTEIRYYSIWGEMVCYFTLIYGLQEMRFL